MKPLFLIFLACALFAQLDAAPKSLAQPTRVLSSERGGNWAKPATWLERKVPQGFQAACIGNDSKVTLDTAVKPVREIAVGGAAPDLAKLVVADGANLSVGDKICVGTSRTNSAAAFEMRGGKLTVADADSPEGCLVVGSSMTYSGKAVATFSGGKYEGGLRAGTTTPHHTGEIIIVGSAPKIACGKYGRNAFELESTGRLTFVLDDKGAATLDYAEGRLVRFESGAAIVVDGKAYRGGAKTLPLLTCPARFEDNGVALKTENFPTGLSASLAFEPLKKGRVLLLKIKASR